MAEELTESVKKLSVETSETTEEQRVFQLLVEHYKEVCTVKLTAQAKIPEPDSATNKALGRLLTEAATHVDSVTVNRFFSRIMRFFEVACSSAPVASNLPPPLVPDEQASKMEKEIFELVRHSIAGHADADVLRVLDSVFFAALPPHLKAFIRANDAWCQARAYSYVQVNRDANVLPELKSWAHSARGILKLQSEARPDEQSAAPVLYGTRIQGVAAGERPLKSLKAYYDESIGNLADYVTVKGEENELKEWDYNALPFIVSVWYLPIAFEENKAAWAEMENVSGIIAQKALGGTFFLVCDLLALLSYFNREEYLRAMLKDHAKSSETATTSN